MIVGNWKQTVNFRFDTNFAPRSFPGLAGILLERGQRLRMLALFVVSGGAHDAPSPTVTHMQA